jgi:hypothetical protein
VWLSEDDQDLVMVQVRADWGIRDSVGMHGWQAIMRQYLRQDRQQAQEAAQHLLMDGPSRAVHIAREALPDAGDEGVSNSSKETLGWSQRFKIGTCSSVSSGICASMCHPSSWKCRTIRLREVALVPLAL